MANSKEHEKKSNKNVLRLCAQAGQFHVNARVKVKHT